MMDRREEAEWMANATHGVESWVDRHRDSLSAYELGVARALTYDAPTVSSDGLSISTIAWTCGLEERACEEILTKLHTLGLIRPVAYELNPRVIEWGKCERFGHPDEEVAADDVAEGQQ